ncbi:glycosyltransferase family 2 protein [Blochmannia endosymbiont of Camponotus (Colobopsis) obliquus]|uniref:glycosyltransferase family 2 protein n=1 Tax=Blochmannia endosymbiont of Camponotus (Colobopsis) obliquus TaxID=1505597 RepID=UPI0008FFCE5B
MLRKSLSIVIITYNVATMLPDCLSSVNWADEIIILDNNSQDQTCSIAKQAGAKIFKTKKWLGFGKQRQMAQTYANGDYIFALDADERISYKLKQEIIEILHNPKFNTVYSCIRYNFFINKFMHYGGWYPDRKIRLYPKNFSFNSMNVHEKLNSKNAEIKKLKGKLIHIACPYLPTFQFKQLKYAETWAIEQFKKTTHCNIITIIIHTFSSFFKTWILKKSFLDGKYGWLLAIINAQYTFNKYSILWSLKRKNKNN